MEFPTLILGVSFLVVHPNEDWFPTILLIIMVENQALKATELVI